MGGAFRSGTIYPLVVQKEGFASFVPETGIRSLKKGIPL
jgi:hypothetical protein